MKNKKTLVAILLLISLLFCSACSTMRDEFPRVEVLRTHWKADTLIIPITDGFILNEKHPYETTKNDVNDSLIITIYFRKEEK